MFLQKHIEGLAGFFLRGKALDNPHPRYILVNKSVQVGGFLAEILPFFVRVVLDQPHADHQEGKAAQRRCGQPRVFDKHNHGHRNHSDKFRDQGSYKVVHHIL